MKTSDTVRPKRLHLTLGAAALGAMLAGCGGQSQLGSAIPQTGAQSAARQAEGHAPPPPVPPCPAGGYPLLTFMGDQSSLVVNAYKQGLAPNTIYCTIANSADPGVAPWGLAVDPGKDLIAGYADGTIWKFAPPYNTTPSLVCNVAPFVPYGMATDNYGTVFGGMYNSNSILACDAGGTTTVLTDPNLINITTIAAGPKGIRNLFVVGYKNSATVEIDETYDGTNWFPLQIGGPATSACPYGFQTPGGLALGKPSASGVDHLWYADGGNGTNGCLYKFKPPYTGAPILTAPAVGGTLPYTGKDTAIALNSNDSHLWAANFQNGPGWRGAQYHSNNGVQYPTSTAAQGPSYGIALTPPSLK
jgi:hypothetical protein